MVKENGMVMMTEEEFKSICKCYEKNISDLQNEHEYETDIICTDYEMKLDRMNREKDELVKEYEKRLGMLQSAVLELTKGTTNGCRDTRVSKADFLAIYNKALSHMDEHIEEETNDIYGFDFTVHWHGIYCNCGDGATAYNYIVSGVEGVQEEDPHEYE